MQGFALFKRVILYGLVGLGAIFLFIFLVSQQTNPPVKRRIRSTLEADCCLESTDDVEEVDVSSEIERVISLGRIMIHEEMTGYQYPNGKYNITASKLEDLVIEENGQPVRSVIVTTWRAGSTFLGELIGSHPGNFYYHEPLADLGKIKIRELQMATNALYRIRALLNCDYVDEQVEWRNFSQIRPYMFREISKTWYRYTANSSIRYDRRNLSAMCKLFPFLSMKIIRLSLQVAQELLADEKLAVRLVLLVRDPRAIIRSRKQNNFCGNSPDCADTALICGDLVSDYQAAVELLKIYPTTFRVIRYEDLARDPYQEAEELSKFYGREFHPKMKEYLDNHTRNRSNDPFSTYKNTDTTPYHWKTELEFSEVEEIQRICATAMEHWGYLPAMNATHLREFHPVTDYGLNASHI